MFAADDGTTPFISILRGGKDHGRRERRATHPPDHHQDRDRWCERRRLGRVDPNGRATINIGATAEGEGGTGTYGGSNDADNSGVLRRRVEYAGKILGTDNELNGFRSTPSATRPCWSTCRPTAVPMTALEFFGGSARLKWAVSTGNTDDSFLTGRTGWRGRGQFWVVHQDPPPATACMESATTGRSTTW